MALGAGTRLGPYEVSAQIGVGGMGEVYRATDTKLGRRVAIKVLPESLAAEPERLARFDREARTLAALNHPNIAAIHGLEEADGLKALVMELVEGPTLADRIAQGPIPVDEALPIAKQIAEALEAAHEQGIVHRDLKPANIKVRPDGTVKVLDFGLAKAMEPSGATAASVNASLSPTVTTPAMTQAGMILGTAAYMSPEQARGRVVDKRADIWAFGCVLYEMVTRRRAFAGEDVADTLGAVIHKEPDWAQLPPGLPPGVRRLIERCLEKDPRRRLRDIGEARLALEEPAAMATTVAAPSVTRMPAWRAWAIAGLAMLLGSAITAVVTRSAASPPKPPVPLKLAVALKPNESVMLFRGVAISPDSTRLAFVSQTGQETPRLVVRHLDGSPDVVFDNTGSATSPFFSPDNQWLGFVAGNRLMKVPVSGGAGEIVTAQARGSGATWAPDGSIFFSGSDGIYRISSAGGEAVRVTALSRDRGEIGHVWPHLLPGADVLLYVAWTGPGWDERQLVARRLASGQETVVARGVATFRYVDSGHLVYTREGRMSAVAFDLATLETTGAPVPLFDDVREGVASADYDMSTGGTLVYVHQGREAYNRVPVLVDRTGAGAPLPGVPPGFYQNPRFSPDGRRALMQRTNATIDVWLYDFERQTFAVLRAGGSNQNPEWSPDGRRVLYRGTRQGLRNLFTRTVDGVGAEERLTTDEHIQRPWSWVGDAISFEQQDPETGGDIALLDAKKGGAPRVVLQTAYNETKARLSPDGKVLAYVSNESGGNQVYAWTLESERREQLSTDGGTDPLWDRSGRQLYYRNGRRVMVLDIVGGRAASRPRLLFEGDFVITNPALDFDVSPDGSRFLMIKASQDERPRAQLEVLLNWQEELRRLVPRGK